MVSVVSSVQERTVLFVSTPALWPSWPFLPVVRRSKGQLELGVMIDSRSLGLTGLSAAVHFANVLDLPATLPEFLALPKEVFDSAEELAAGGWEVD